MPMAPEARTDLFLGPEQFNAVRLIHKIALLAVRAAGETLQGRVARKEVIEQAGALLPVVEEVLDDPTVLALYSIVDCLDCGGPTIGRPGLYRKVPRSRRLTRP